MTKMAVLLLLLHIHYTDISRPTKLCRAERFLIVEVLVTSYVDSIQRIKCVFALCLNMNSDNQHFKTRFNVSQEQKKKKPTEALTFFTQARWNKRRTVRVCCVHYRSSVHGPVLSHIHPLFSWCHVEWYFKYFETVTPWVIICMHV